jgi:hypothetical protein
MRSRRRGPSQRPFNHKPGQKAASVANLYYRKACNDSHSQIAIPERRCDHKFDYDAAQH